MTAIAHAEALETTDQTHTGDTNWTTKLTLASGNFVAGGKYLIICLAQVGGNDTAQEFGFRLVHGATPTVFTGSSMRIQPSNSTRRHGYGYFTVFDQPGGGAEDVIFQIKPFIASDIARADTIHIIAIRLDDDLIENTDWVYNEDTTLETHTATFGDTQGATITFTPGNNNDDWLILANPFYLVNNVGKQVEYRINRDGADFAPLFSQEPEDLSEQLTWLMHRAWTLSDSSHTFTVEGRDEDLSGSENQHSSSRIFALRLDAFKDHGSVWNEAEVAPTGIHPTFDEVGAIDITPSVQADFLMLGYMSLDAATTATGYLRIQEGGATTPVGSDDFLISRARSYDGSDECPCATMALENLAASSQDLDLDASTSTTLSRYEDRSFVAVSMELAAVGEAFEAARQFGGEIPVYAPNEIVAY